MKKIISSVLALVAIALMPSTASAQDFGKLTDGQNLVAYYTAETNTCKGGQMKSYTKGKPGKMSVNKAVNGSNIYSRTYTMKVDQPLQAGDKVIIQASAQILLGNDVEFTSRIGGKVKKDASNPFHQEGTTDKGEQLSADYVLYTYTLSAADIEKISDNTIAFRRAKGQSVYIRSIRIVREGAKLAL